MSELRLSVGIVGATGAVGNELLELLAQRDFPVEKLRLFASERSAGKKQLQFKGRDIPVDQLSESSFDDLDVAFFAAGSAVAKRFGPIAESADCFVLDKSSAFRGERPLVIPEINPQELDRLGSNQRIIASPNCSTAVALMALWPLHQEFGLKRFFAATYQSVSGTGAAAVDELDAQLLAYAGIPEKKDRLGQKGRSFDHHVYDYQIALNVIPQVDSFTLDGYTGEEVKMREESRIILAIKDLKVSATCVRVPVLRAHSVAINAEFDRDVSVEGAREAIAAFPGAALVDDPLNQRYPTPLDFSGKAKCGVGRIRKDTAFEKGLSFWVSGDNLWKGAALNSIQIAEELISRGQLKPKTVLA